MIQYADIVYDTVVDGVGLRNTLYVSGCSHNCKGCHNKPLQDYNYGKKEHITRLAELLTINDNHITLSGGEPFQQVNSLTNLIIDIKILDDKKDIKRNFWIYSGFLFEEIIQDPTKLPLLEECDVLVDGKFEIDKKDLNLKFCGSKNQRIIDVQASLRENKIVKLEL